MTKGITTIICIKQKSDDKGGITTDMEIVGDEPTSDMAKIIINRMLEHTRIMEVR